MRGRYGMDRLSHILTVTAVLLTVIAMITQIPLLNIIALLIMTWIMFRTYSRNITRRRRENELLLRAGRLIKRNFALLKLKIKDAGRHRFRTCPGCRVVIRTSTKRGRRTLKCPKCGMKFETRIV